MTGGSLLLMQSIYAQLRLGSGLSEDNRPGSQIELAQSQPGKGEDDIQQTVTQVGGRVQV